MRRPLPPGIRLDRALCVLLALLSLAGLVFGLTRAHPAIAGGGCFGLVCAAWAAQVLFDREALRRSRAVRAARERGWY
ncbi:hypothetical protein [Variovorax sp. W6]|uniref:hypothetical protein n=1 Tax=Variovorax sp. W6 TaxID=3093895 RepID=UPI003D8026BE